MTAPLTEKELDGFLSAGLTIRELQHLVADLRAARAALLASEEVIERHKAAYVGCRRPISLIQIEIDERAALPPEGQ